MLDEYEVILRGDQKHRFEFIISDYAFPLKSIKVNQVAERQVFRRDYSLEDFLLLVHLTCRQRRAHPDAAVVPKPDRKCIEVPDSPKTTQRSRDGFDEREIESIFRIFERLHNRAEYGNHIRKTECDFPK
jgi:hypothetical protein